MNKETESQIVANIKSMIEISFEYAGWNKDEIDAIYIFCSTEESFFFTFFFSVKGLIVERHKINDHLTRKCNTSIEQQFATDKIGGENLQKIVDLFKTEEEEVPSSIRVVYHPSTEKMNVKFDYQKRIEGTDLMEEDLVEDWISSLTPS